jgi:hypothetical protein
VYLQSILSTLFIPRFSRLKDKTIFKSVFIFQILLFAFRFFYAFRVSLSDSDAVDLGTSYGGCLQSSFDYVIQLYWTYNSMTGQLIVVEVIFKLIVVIAMNLSTVVIAFYLGFSDTLRIFIL